MDMHAKMKVASCVARLMYENLVCVVHVARAEAVLQVGGMGLLFNTTLPASLQHIPAPFGALKRAHYGANMRFGLVRERCRDLA